MIKLNENTTLYRKEEYNLPYDANVYFIDFKNNRNHTKRLLKKFIEDIPNIKAIVITNFDEEVIDIFKAIYLTDRKKRIEFIYDTICKNLDKKWEQHSPCDFCDNRCIASRNNFMDREFNGCCYSFERKRMRSVDKRPCEFLGQDKKCKTQNISCKLFTCDYLKRKGEFDTNYDDYLLLKLFFTRKEKLIIKYNFFKSREAVIEKLLEKNNTPYLIYLLKMEFLIEKQKSTSR